MKYFRLLLLFLCGGTVLWLFVSDFVVSDKMTVVYDFCKSQSMITELSPGDRLWPIVKGDDCYQDVAKSPVYFDVRVPQVFDRASLKIIYKNESGESFALGPQTTKNEWLWLLKDIEVVDENNGWLEGRSEYDLRGVYQASPVMRWLVSIPSVEENKHVVRISEIKITYYKESLSFSNLVNQAKCWFRKIIR